MRISEIFPFTWILIFLVCSSFVPALTVGSKKCRRYQAAVICFIYSWFFLSQEIEIYFTQYLGCTSSFQQQKHKKIKPWTSLHQSVFYCSSSESSLHNAIAVSEYSSSGGPYWREIPSTFFKALLEFLFSRPLPLRVQFSCDTQ